MTQPNALTILANRESADDRAGVPLTVADLSDSEREWLLMGRRNDDGRARIAYVSAEKYTTLMRAQKSLLRKGLICHTNASGFYRLTDEGARLQAALHERGDTP